MTGLVTAICERLRRLICGVRGHDAVLHFADDRMLMRCHSCGHDSPGWKISGLAECER